MAQADFCPAGLFWNNQADQCDWPNNVDCSFTKDKAREKKLKQKTFLYLTFDDGPNAGTPEVLDVLRKHGVRATFFINSNNLEIDEKKPGQVWPLTQFLSVCFFKNKSMTLSRGSTSRSVSVSNP